ncbi:MAG: zinc ribbon domain-containing protein [Candidatus Limnocylindrales bacterium]|nr:zinc ribbon domain-containing protein [Candidatus Limnocylindrales bacterium]
MPLYDYDCAACGRRLEVVHGVHAPGPAHCPNCGGGPLKKAITAPAVHFKGSGWAKRDRRATVAPGTSKASTDAPATADGEVKDSGGASGGSKAEGGADGGANRAADGPGEPAAAASKTTAAGTATKTD